MLDSVEIACTPAMNWCSGKFDLRIRRLPMAVRKGPGCSKLMTSLVNVTAKASHIFSTKNIGIFEILMFEILTKRNEQSDLGILGPVVQN